MYVSINLRLIDNCLRFGALAEARFLTRADISDEISEGFIAQAATFLRDEPIVVQKSVVGPRFRALHFSSFGGIQLTTTFREVVTRCYSSHNY